LEKNYLWQLIRAPLVAAVVMMVCVGGGEMAFKQIIFLNGAIGLLILTGLVVIGIMIYAAVLWKLSPGFVRDTYAVFLRLTRQVPV
jgi:hypothetical protein